MRRTPLTTDANSNTFSRHIATTAVYLEQFSSISPWPVTHECDTRRTDQQLPRSRCWYCCRAVRFKCRWDACDTTSGMGSLREISWMRDESRLPSDRIASKALMSRLRLDASFHKCSCDDLHGYTWLTG